MMVGSARNASYSKNPQMKDGSIRALIYNDALYRGKQHLLRDEFNPNRIGKPEVPASWKIEGKTPASVEPRGYNAPALTHDQKYALPDHQYTFLSFPLLGGDRGGKISQRIRYEEMLPTCAGKLHKLEWSHLTEEDRYTKRNFLIREAQRRNEDSNDLDGMNDNAAGHSKGGARGLYARAIAIALVALYWTGFPGTNSRSMNTVDPMNESETCKDEHWIASVPILGSLFTDLVYTTAPLFPIHDGFHGQTASKVQCVPMWAETDGDVRAIGGAARSHLTSSSVTHLRDANRVPRVPKQSWLESNNLYYDDAEGPDRIGNYNVHPWKTGTEDSYQNAKMSGDTIDEYNPMNHGMLDCK